MKKGESKKTEEKKDQILNEEAQKNFELQVIQNETKSPTKTDFILQWVKEGKTRKFIIDQLVEMSGPKAIRKSSASLCSQVLKKHNLLNKVESGIENRKRKNKTKEKNAKKAESSKLDV